MKTRVLVATLGVGAIVLALGLSSAPVAAQQAPAKANGEGAAVATPRTAKGVPDFSGIWVGTQKRGEVPAAFDPTTGNYSTTPPGRTGSPVDFERDPGLRTRLVSNRPIYKPQYWSRVQFSDVHGHAKESPDPTFLCLPDGVPRIGMPQEILQTDTQMIFIYPLHVRRIYLDGRPHPPVEHYLGTWFGHSIGRWEGDTLIIDTVDFNGQEWLGWPGWITSPDKHVVERMKREGNTLTWEATVEDPILVKPWSPPGQRRQLNLDPMAEIEEPLPCLEQDLEHMFTRERG
jgi:hypothetical protein